MPSPIWDINNITPTPKAQTTSGKMERTDFKSQRITRHDKYATSMKTQHYGCLKMTLIMTTPPDNHWRWRKFCKTLFLDEE